MTNLRKIVNYIPQRNSDDQRCYITAQKNYCKNLMPENKPL